MVDLMTVEEKISVRTEYLTSYRESNIRKHRKIIDKVEDRKTNKYNKYTLAS